MKSYRVAVLGCGVIGYSWAKAFLAAGHIVRCWDFNSAAGKKINQLKESNEDADVTFFSDVDQAVQGADFVQENCPEDLLLKQNLYRQLEPCIGAEALLASSTSTLQATQLQQGISFAKRIVIGHPFNPPDILPLVEVVGGKQTSEHSIRRAMEFYKGLGKQAIQLKIERPGHLANRLQAAIWREAVDAVASGQASVEDVDLAMTSALGPRWATMGPFKTFELGGGEGGLAHFLDHLGGAFEALWDDAERPPMTKELKKQLIADAAALTAGQTAQECVQDRDNQLISILALSQKSC